MIDRQAMAVFRELLEEIWPRDMGVYNAIMRKHLGNNETKKIGVVTTTPGRVAAWGYQDSRSIGDSFVRHYRKKSCLGDPCKQQLVKRM